MNDSQAAACDDDAVPTLNNHRGFDQRFHVGAHHGEVRLTGHHIGIKRDDFEPEGAPLRFSPHHARQLARLLCCAADIVDGIKAPSRRLRLIPATEWDRR